MFERLGELVGSQLTALVAIVSLGVIAVIGMLTGTGSEVTVPCVTGIAGIAGVLRSSGVAVPKDGSVTTTVTSNGGSNG